MPVKFQTEGEKLLSSIRRNGSGRTGIAAQGLVGGKLVVGRSTDPVVGRVVRGVRGFPVERRHGEIVDDLSKVVNGSVSQRVVPMRKSWAMTDLVPIEVGGRGEEEAIDSRRKSE